MKKALVTGITGQDGAYLAKLLLEKGYKVFGGKRRSSSAATWRLHEMGIEHDVEYVTLELLEAENIHRTIKKIAPDEIYNLAAQSFVAASFDLPVYTTLATGLSVCYMLEALRELPETRFYQASTSELYGKVERSPQDEFTPFRPRSPYAVSKQYAHWLTVNYRESYNLFASTGILFNHESPMRGIEFVTRKITAGLAMFCQAKGGPIKLGNLDSQRDWGFAGDYVKGIWMILNHDKAADYVLATGQTHSVRKFVEAAAAELGLQIHWEGEGTSEVGKDQNGRVVVEVSPEFFRPAEVDYLLGDATKARQELGWAPEVDFDQLARMMARTDYDRFAKSGRLD
jgi:GDPmannose 4,6-dehydratase